MTREGGRSQMILACAALRHDQAALQGRENALREPVESYAGWFWPVRIIAQGLQQRLVCFKDQRIFAAMPVAIFGLGDLPERITRLHGIKFGFRGFVGGGDIVLHRADPHRIANGECDFLRLFRRGGGARKNDFVAVGLDVDFGNIETVFLGLLLQLIGELRPIYCRRKS